MVLDARTSVLGLLSLGNFDGFKGEIFDLDPATFNTRLAFGFTEPLLPATSADPFLLKLKLFPEKNQTEMLHRKDSVEIF